VEKSRKLLMRDYSNILRDGVVWCFSGGRRQRIWEHTGGQRVPNKLVGGGGLQPKRVPRGPPPGELPSNGGGRAGLPVNLGPGAPERAPTHHRGDIGSRPRLKGGGRGYTFDQKNGAAPPPGQIPPRKRKTAPPEGFQVSANPQGA